MMKLKFKTRETLAIMLDMILIGYKMKDVNDNTFLNDYDNLYSLHFCHYVSDMLTVMGISQSLKQP